MAWQTPKTDWEESNGVRDTDFNRIEGNILELYEKGAMRADKVIYVNATTGNDDSGTGSVSFPFATIGKALSAIPRTSDGYEALISIAEGTYNESVTIRGFDAPLTLTGSNDDVVVINGLRVVGCHCELSNIELSIRGAAYITGGATLTGEGSIHMDGYTLNVNYGSTVFLDTLTCDNASSYAINVNKGGKLCVASLYGSGNSTGITCQTGGVVTYGLSALEADDVLYVTASGGRIYSDSQYSIPEF